MTMQISCEQETRPGAPGIGMVSVASSRPCPERVNDRAKFIMHRLIALRLSADPQMLGYLRARLSDGDMQTPDHLREWQAILDDGVEATCRQLRARSERMYRLRLSSPLVGLLDFSEPSLRRRLYSKARIGLRAPGSY